MGYHTKPQQESEVILTSTSTCSPLKCACCAPSEGGASRYLPSGYMLGPYESAKEEEEKLQEGQRDFHRLSS